MNNSPNNISSLNNDFNKEIANLSQIKSSSQLNEINFINNNIIKWKIDPNKIEVIIRKEDKSTQTDPFPLYKKEEEKDAKTQNINQNNLNKKHYKDSPDLIRSKLFNYFNKMLYSWLNKPKIEARDIIIHYRLKKNNKYNIKETMNKFLKELFISPENINRINQINNNLLKKKLDYKYENIYNFFISNKNEIQKDEEYEEFFENFIFLDDYLKELAKIEKKDYARKIKEIALTYYKWKDYKCHIIK